MDIGTLYFFCGKMGAGKTTHSRKLAAQENAVLISEDEWLAQLFPEQIETLDDYVLYSARMRPLVEAHVKNILATGTDVVLDFPANTEKQRQWFKRIYESAQAKGLMIYIEASDERCLEQLGKRNIEQPERAVFDNETVFRQVTSFFQEPADSEGFDIKVIS